MSDEITEAKKAQNKTIRISEYELLEEFLQLLKKIEENTRK
jgi:hypothetical protein